MNLRQKNSRPVSQVVLFNKPYGVLSQFTPEHGHLSLADFGLPKGVYPAGRLDLDSEGLLILTSDGALIHRLLDPFFEHPRTYWAQVEGVPGREALQSLECGLRIKGGYMTRPAKALLLEPQPDIPERVPPIRFRKTVPTAWIELTLTEGKNRQVRSMTAAVGHPTLRLVRVAIGNICLGDLAPRSWKMQSVYLADDGIHLATPKLG